MTQNGQNPQVQMVYCNECGLLRMPKPAGPAKLTLVGTQQQVGPCPFCMFRADVMRNMEGMAAAIGELQGMAMPVIQEAAVAEAEAILSEGEA